MPVGTGGALRLDIKCALTRTILRMRATVVTWFGAPDVHTVPDVPDFHPDHGEVVIDVTVASVLRVER